MTRTHRPRETKAWIIVDPEGEMTDSISWTKAWAKHRVDELPPGYRAIRVVITPL